MLTVVVSQGQSRAPEKRQLEEQIAAAFAGHASVRSLLIPHLYDLTANGRSVQQLRAIDGPIVVCSWMYQRATHWVLDRVGVAGQLQPSELEPAEEDADEMPIDAQSAETTAVSGTARPIWCLDLRWQSDPAAFVGEIERIATTLPSEPVDETTGSQPVGLNPEANLATPPTTATRTLSLADLLLADGDEEDDEVLSESAAAAAGAPVAIAGPTDVVEFPLRIEEHPGRRWYPVIDFSRCTNCMECIDFCLFGVYGVDGGSRILVEQPDNCRKGCPACSRICPANAIIFPQHKAPAIAGAAGESGGFKIDLSKLFGAADESDDDPLATAARERDEHLILAGRSAVTTSTQEAAAEGPRTVATVRGAWRAETPAAAGLADLIDQLDAADL